MAVIENEQLKIGYVLFIDIVGYSKLLIEDQKERLRQLTEIVLATAQVREATNEQLVRLPTGDGMALVFRNSAEEPTRCGLEIAQALKAHPEIKVRMGIHGGPVSEVSDLTGRTNIAGAGINLAQRVMDCGDAGHILLSQRVADDLAQYRQWSASLHDLGECEVKHKIRLHIFNLYTAEAGNPAVPKKLKKTRKRKITPAVPLRPVTTRRSLGWLVLVTVLAVAALLFALQSFWRRLPTQPATDATQSSARAEQEKVVQMQPGYGPSLCVLALIDAGLGNKEVALEEGRHAVELLPVEKDALNGGVLRAYLAIIAAWTGEKDLALEQLAFAATHSNALPATYGGLKLLPFWDPLRGDPRFEQIVASLAPKEHAENSQK